MISSGRLSDRNTKALVNENGSCNTDCPFISNNKETCNKIEMKLSYKNDLPRAMCNEADHVAMRNNRSLNI